MVTAQKCERREDQHTVHQYISTHYTSAHYISAHYIGTQ